MTVLRNIEAKIESLFEGVFGRAFRTNVQPVELARKLVKEMEDHRVISVSRLYVPNEYTLYLSPADRAQFEDYEESLLSELQEMKKVISGTIRMEGLEQRRTAFRIGGRHDKRYAYTAKFSNRIIRDGAATCQVGLDRCPGRRLYNCRFLCARQHRDGYSGYSPLHCIHCIRLYPAKIPFLYNEELFVRSCI